MHDEATNKPVKVFRCGAVQAAIWTNQRVIDNAVVEVHSVRIDKSYKEGQQWKRTTIFAAEDLPKVFIVAMEVYRYLRVRSFDNGACDPDETPETGCSGTDMQPQPL